MVPAIGAAVGVAMNAIDALTQSQSAGPAKAKKKTGIQPAAFNVPAEKSSMPAKASSSVLLSSSTLLAAQSS
jgi:hypothetical protein